MKLLYINRDKDDEQIYQVCEKKNGMVALINDATEEPLWKPVSFLEEGEIFDDYVEVLFPEEYPITYV